MVNKSLSHEDRQAQPFDIEVLGASFREVAVDVVRGENTDFINRWFRASSNDADFMIWLDGEKRIVKQQFCFFGQVVEWSPIHGTRTGLVVEEEIVSSTQSSEESVSETVQFDSVLQQAAVQQAARMLQNIPGLSEHEKSTLIFNLQQSVKLHKRARERALKTWAPEGHEIVSMRRPSFWKRVRSWVAGGEN